MSKTSTKSSCFSPTTTTNERIARNGKKDIFAKVGDTDTMESCDCTVRLYCYDIDCVEGFASWVIESITLKGETIYASATDRVNRHPIVDHLIAIHQWKLVNTSQPRQIESTYCIIDERAALLS